MILISLLFGVLPLSEFIAADTKIRVVTWNVADNGGMQGGYTNIAIDRVLGLDKDDSDRPTIYAIGLQENCWKCSTENMTVIGERFLSRIDMTVGGDQYAVIGIHGTRMSTDCETCSHHGTTAVLVIGKKSLNASHSTFRQNGGCSKKGNVEKGIAAIKITLTGGKAVCFGAGHLDSSSSAHKRVCFKNFFGNATESAGWEDCDAQYIFGDFNTRTGDKGHGPDNVGISVINVGALRKNDELTGSTPYGRDAQWNGSLLSYINKIQTTKFSECAVNFKPTYSIKKANASCGGKFPCYRENRPRSWTDRILYSVGECLTYNAIYEEYGDHFPVFAEYTLDLYSSSGRTEFPGVVVFIILLASVCMNFFSF